MIWSLGRAFCRYVGFALILRMQTGKLCRVRVKHSMNQMHTRTHLLIASDCRIRKLNTE